jgi:hypothetical protein
VEVSTTSAHIEYMMMREYSTEMVSSGRILSFSAVADEFSSGKKKHICRTGSEIVDHESIC